MVIARHLLMVHWHLIDPENASHVSDNAASHCMLCLMERNGLSNQKKTHAAQKKKKMTKKEIEDFVDHITGKTEMLGIIHK